MSLAPSAVDQEIVAAIDDIPVPRFPRGAIASELRWRRVRRSRVTQYVATIALFLSISVAGVSAAAIMHAVNFKLGGQPWTVWMVRDRLIPVAPIAVRALLPEGVPASMAVVSAWRIEGDRGQYLVALESSRADAFISIETLAGVADSRASEPRPYGNGSLRTTWTTRGERITMISHGLTISQLRHIQ